VSAALLDQLPPEQRLALAYAPGRTRSATLGLFALDARLAAILRGKLEPIAAQLRLAWWRELLAQAPATWPKGEPVLKLLRHWQDPTGLAALPSAWEALLVDELSVAVIAEFTAGRAQAFGCLARELGLGDVTAAESSARVWATADLAAHLSAGEERQRVVDYARSLPPPQRLPASLRSLAILASFGQHALARGGMPLLGGPLSALIALRTGLFGR
jgi:phytoene synthase